VSISGATTTDTPRFDDEARHYDALLVLSFGGPEGPDDVRPFLQNVTAGRSVPPARLDEVAEHYLHFGGVSPINAQNRALIAALETELATHGPRLPIYFGNRNWHPFVTDTIRQMHEDGVERALVFVTSAFSSYSGCRQYREDVIRALDKLQTETPVFDKLRVFYNHPGFIEPMIARTRAALDQVPVERGETTRLVFTAHSIPLGMARHAAYESQLRETSRLIAETVGIDNYLLAYQSRSGPPQVPWLEPDILDVLATLRNEGATDVVVVPVGFISDHMEILFDLDTEARETAAELGLNLVRAATVGTDPAFVRMIRDLIVERMTPHPDRPALGSRGPSHDVCPLHCCLIGSGRLATPASS
jgi:protoporphyrin/coproporphyrin ferrochelatase